MSPINLASVMIGVCIELHFLLPAALTHIPSIGNGCTDWATMNPAYYYAQCEDPLMAPIVDIA